MLPSSSGGETLHVVLGAEQAPTPPHPRTRSASCWSALMPSLDICRATSRMVAEPAAVVVYAGALDHGVEVGAHHDRAVRAALRRVGDDVGGRARSPTRVEVEHAHAGPCPLGPAA